MAGTARQVPGVEAFRPQELLSHRLPGCLGIEGDAIVVSLPAPHGQLTARFVLVPYPQVQGFMEAEAPSVEEECDGSGRGDHVAQDRTDLIPGQDRGKPAGLPGPDDDPPVSPPTSRGIRSTSRQRKRRAARAWDWVEASTFPSTARALRKAFTWSAPSSEGWRRPWCRT
jgi:hypothetical protein